MGLLELCLLSLLSPQEPAPTTPTTTPGEASATTVTATSAAAPSGDDERAKLQAAERAGAKADPEVLGELTASPNEKVAARAAYLLGRLTGDAAIAACNRTATKSPHTAARLQVMNALLRHAHVTSVAPAIAALEDADRGVRTLAAQLLGKLRRPAAVPPLLALLERATDTPSTDPLSPAAKATDVQAALLALNDLDARDHLLRAATSLQDRPARGAGEALTWCFQNLSPKLDRKQEVTLLVAVLGHREPLLRRYAIGRLGVLAEPTTATALEGRLATEGPELRPLVEVALSQVRADRTAQSTEGLQRLLDAGKGLAAQARTRWNELSERERWIVAGSPVSILLLFFVVGRLRRRRVAAESAAATMALVAPSDEHLEELAAEAEAIEAAAHAEALAEEGQNTGTAEDEVAVEDDGLVRR